MPCAARPGEVAKRLASWFHAWGDDVFPLVGKCKTCGNAVIRSKQSSQPPDTCDDCLKPLSCRVCREPVGGPRVRYGVTCDKCRRAFADRKRAARAAAKKKYGRNHRERCRYYGAPYTPIKLVDVYERDNWTCQICGVDLNRKWKTGDPKGRTIDHIIPLSLGPDGPGHVMSNVRAACHRCNSLKGDSIVAAASDTLH